MEFAQKVVQCAHVLQDVMGVDRTYRPIGQAAQGLLEVRHDVDTAETPAVQAEVPWPWRLTAPDVDLERYVVVDRLDNLGVHDFHDTSAALDAGEPNEPLHAGPGHEHRARPAGATTLAPPGQELVAPSPYYGLATGGFGWKGMRFVFATDDGFTMPTGVAIRSLDRFLDPSDEIVVLHLGLDEGGLGRLASCAQSSSLRAIDCRGRLHPSWVANPPLSASTFLRMLIPELLPDADRCVYLDSDLLVRQSPVPLHDAQLSGRTLGAVRSRTTPFIASKDGIVQWWELGIRSAAPYFNAGVLVMDLARWRSRDVTGRATSFLDRYGEQTSLADQDALNVAAIDDWTELDRRWNYVAYITQYFLQQPEAEPDDPAIVHFAGPNKPWTAGVQPLYAEEWHQLVAQTPWAGFVTPAPSTGPRTRVRRGVSRILRRVKELSKE